MRTEDEKFHINELEANEFAGNLLMPRPVIEKELSDANSKQLSEKKVRQLSAGFGVSALAMAIRLKNLGYGV